MCTGISWCRRNYSIFRPNVADGNHSVGCSSAAACFYRHPVLSVLTALFHNLSFSTPTMPSTTCEHAEESVGCKLWRSGLPEHDISIRVCTFTDPCFRYTAGLQRWHSGNANGNVWSKTWVVQFLFLVTILITYILTALHCRPDHFRVPALIGK